MMWKRRLGIFTWIALGLMFFSAPVWGAEPIKIGIVQGFSGALEAYAKQMLTGFKMGLEYGTNGKNEVLGRKIDLIVEDDQLKPDVAKRLITKLYADDKVDLVVGTTSSAAALAMLPVAMEFKKILLVEPAVADSITGSAWNRTSSEQEGIQVRMRSPMQRLLPSPESCLPALARIMPLEETASPPTRRLLRNWGQK